MALALTSGGRGSALVRAGWRRLRHGVVLVGEGAWLMASGAWMMSADGLTRFRTPFDLLRALLRWTATGLSALSAGLTLALRSLWRWISRLPWGALLWVALVTLALAAGPTLISVLAEGFKASLPVLRQLALPVAMIALFAASGVAVALALGMLGSALERAFESGVFRSVLEVDLTRFRSVFDLLRSPWRWSASGLSALSARLALALHSLWRWISSRPWGAWLGVALTVLAFATALLLAIVLAEGLEASLPIVRQLVRIAAVLALILAVAVVGALALRMLGSVLERAFGSRVFRSALWLVLLCALATAAALVTPRFYPSVGAAAVAGIALVTMVAGLAAVSFGPTLVAIVSVHIGGGRPPVRPVQSPPRTGRWRVWTLAATAFFAAALLLVFEVSRHPAAPTLPIRRSGNEPAVSLSAPRSVTRVKVAGKAPHRELALRLDGVVGEAAWRSGYRGAVTRMGDAGPIRSLALGPEACAAPVIVAVGAASSDGDAAANRRLALLRARWLAEWSAGQLASCSGARSPVIVVASIGQAREGPAGPRQRQLRLLVLDADEALDEARVRQALGARLHIAPERVDICVLQSRAATLSWPCP